ncbi:hypothetical protein HW555_009233 [Spodoptera exigua]|uniref:Gag-like protein n=1 Tax=Spodoptera exigua TaxID=7107 RepID=A0A835GB32_SPOEX|nr:hypothetical protein HW555_009233 [Spodoptera exigua]
MEEVMCQVPKCYIPLPNNPTTPAAPTAQTVPQDLPREDPLLPSTTPSNQPWVKVVSKKRKGKKKVAPKPPAAKPAAAAEKRKKLPLPPKSAAVVVTLTPEAAERGETYESVLRRARTNVDPAQLGAGRVTCRRTQTGARIFEFSGAQGGTKADLFASKLREAVTDTAKVKALKCRAASLLGIVKELAQRTTSDETRQLQAKVDRLQKEVSALHARVAELMARPEGTSEGPASMLAPSNLEDIIRKVVMEERAFTRACFAGIEDRLLPEKWLRLPLAADRAPERTPSAPGPSTAPAQRQPKGKGKGKGKKTTPATPTAQTVPQDLPREDPLLSSTTPSNQPWTKVVPRKRKGKKKVAPKPPAAKPAAAVEKRKKLPLPPKSAAVVVTLTPEAVERGETYESVLRRARANVDPAQLGAGRVTCRKTQTGARIFEFSGAQGGTKAELFAAKLREAVADTAKIVRPVKCVALEVTDLDDTVTQEEVVAAVAAAGGCAVESIKSRAIRPGRGGMGTMRLECPIACAKAVLAKVKMEQGFSLSSGMILCKEFIKLTVFLKDGDL